MEDYVPYQCNTPDCTNRGAQRECRQCNIQHSHGMVHLEKEYKGREDFDFVSYAWYLCHECSEVEQWSVVGVQQNGIPDMDTGQASGLNAIQILYYVRDVSTKLRPNSMIQKSGSGTWKTTGILDNFFPLDPHITCFYIDSVRVFFVRNFFVAFFKNHMTSCLSQNC